MLTSANFELISSSGIIRGSISKMSNSPRKCLICLHGNPGGDLHGNMNIFDQIKEIVTEHDIAVIQFSFYGALPSEGKPTELSLETQMEDYTRILTYARSQFSCSLTVVAESAGATVAALDWDQPDVNDYALLWPAFDLRDTDLRSFFNPSYLKKVLADGSLNDGAVILGKKYYLEILSTDFTSCFHLPAKEFFIAHGRQDSEVPFLQSLQAFTGTSKIAKWTCFWRNHGYHYSIRSDCDSGPTRFLG